MSRRFQFSLRWLFVAMLVVAAFFGGAAWQRNEWLGPLLEADVMNEFLRRENDSLRSQLRDCETSQYRK
jgi:hypothetical protein